MAQETNATLNGEADTRRRVRELVDRVGVAAASRRLGLGRLTTAALAGGLRVRVGSLAQAQLRLEAIAREEPTP